MLDHTCVIIPNFATAGQTVWAYVGGPNKFSGRLGPVPLGYGHVGDP